MKNLQDITYAELVREWPFAADWLTGYRFTCSPNQTLGARAAELPDGYFRDIDRTREAFFSELEDYIRDMRAFLGEEEEDVRTVTLLPGHDKAGKPETFASITWRAGEVIAIVGATGSGKSRLLADIEWQADGDTPTGRHVLVDGHNARSTDRRHLVAQLSQNMNFVMDATVKEFLRLHAESLRREQPDRDAERALDMANELAGEPFGADTPLTGLSGGQSRALMIADCALLSDAPIVLIDEIENAGINRRKALHALTGEKKIVLMATHDPVLALLADRRLVIRNGGVAAVLEKSREESEALHRAEEMDARLMRMRETLRDGGRLSGDAF